MQTSAIVLLLLTGALLGALSGWIASLVSQLERNAAIYLAIAAGALGGIVGPLLVGLDSGPGSVISSMLAAIVLVTLVAVAGRKRRRTQTSFDQP